MSRRSEYLDALDEQAELADIATDTARALQRAEAAVVRRIAQRDQNRTRETVRVAADAIARVDDLRVAVEETEANFRAAQAAAAKVACVLRPEPLRTSWPRAHSRRVVR